MVQRDIALAEMTGASVHICHMARDVAPRRARRETHGPRLVRVAPHHFTLTDESLAAPRELRHY